MRIAALAAAAPVIACASAWGAGLLYFAGPSGESTRAALALIPAIIGLGAIGTLFVPRWRVPGLATFGVTFVVLLVFWSRIQPSNDREWRAEVAKLPYATIDGDRVTVHNIRNFEYRTETDFTPRYYDRTFDLRKLDSVDLGAVYWMGPAVAHLFVSFGFGDDHLAVSIEARKERTESYSTLGGFFRQYELIYIVGDERDVIGLRTNYRKDPPEDVYLMRLNAPIENGRRFFLEYMRVINGLRAQPKFYNTLATNCTTAILMNARVNPGHLGYSWKILASGYTPEYLYDAGRLDSGRPFPELMRRSRVNDAALAADGSADFSRRIRAGLPGMGVR
ncbi:MAG TPA: DUF4105 domain-containing protein [Burkholderiales bacterium]|nr:DUF4105 domain-containing protein [Burkholderiales bacterium]